MVLVYCEFLTCLFIHLPVYFLFISTLHVGRHGKRYMNINYKEEENVHKATLQRNKHSIRKNHNSL